MTLAQAYTTKQLLYICHTKARLPLHGLVPGVQLCHSKARCPSHGLVPGVHHQTTAMSHKWERKVQRSPEWSFSCCLTFNMFYANWAANNKWNKIGLLVDFFLWRLRVRIRRIIMQRVSTFTDLFQTKCRSFWCTLSLILNFLTELYAGIHRATPKWRWGRKLPWRHSLRVTKSCDVTYLLVFKSTFLSR
jgi:hypothetical protein